MKIRSNHGVVAAGVLGVIIAGASPVSAAGPFDPIRDFCRRFYHQSARIGNRLYIDGGYVTYSSEPNNNKTNNDLTFHDLSNDENRQSPLIANLTKPAEVPRVAGGALWADQANEKLFLFGGEFLKGSPLPGAGIFTYDPWVDEWEAVTNTTGGNTIQRPAYGMSTVVEHLGRGYYLGGWLSSKSVAGWTGPRKASDKLIKYNFVDNNIRSTPGPKGDPRVEGAMMYVPTGDVGLLVAFGGIFAEGGSEDKTYAAPMDEIDVFDPAQERWQRVKASGEIPPKRKRFCGAIVSAKDKSSHNIYIYGGAGPDASSPGADDVYILSMPSFRWFKYWTHPDANYHNGFTCDMVNDSQMFVIGGTFPHNEGACDAPTAQGSHYLDLGRTNEDRAEWYGYRKDFKGYNVPTEIFQKLGGGPDGGATVTQPEHGFNNSVLATLFQRKLDAVPREPTRTPDFSNGGPNIGVIIGPSLGVGIPALAAMFGFYLVRRRRNQRKAVEEQIAREQNLQKLQYPENSYQLPNTYSVAYKRDDPQLPRYPYTAQPIYPMGDGKYKLDTLGSEHTYTPPVAPTELPAGSFDFQIPAPQELSATRDSLGARSVGPPPPPPPPKDNSVHRRSMSTSAQTTGSVEQEPARPWTSDGKSSAVGKPF